MRFVVKVLAAFWFIAEDPELAVLVAFCFVSSVCFEVVHVLCFRRVLICFSFCFGLRVLLYVSFWRYRFSRVLFKQLFCCVLVVF